MSSVTLQYTVRQGADGLGIDVAMNHEVVGIIRGGRAATDGFVCIGDVILRVNCRTSTRQLKPYIYVTVILHDSRTINVYRVTVGSHHFARRPRGVPRLCSSAGQFSGASD